MFGRWLTLPRAGPGLLRGLPPVVTSTSTVDGTGFGVQWMRPTARNDSGADAPRARDGRLFLIPDRGRAIGLQCPGSSNRT